MSDYDAVALRVLYADGRAVPGVLYQLIDGATKTPFGDVQRSGDDSSAVVIGIPQGEETVTVRASKGTWSETRTFPRGKVKFDFISDLPPPSTTDQAADRSNQKLTVWSFAVGIGFTVLLLVLSSVIPQPSDAQRQIWQAVLAVALAAFANGILGLLEVTLNIPQVGLGIRAVGAIGIAVIVYFFAPAFGKQIPQPVEQNPPTTSGGSESRSSSSSTSSAVSSSAVSKEPDGQAELEVKMRGVLAQNDLPVPGGDYSTDTLESNFGVSQAPYSMALSYEVLHGNFSYLTDNPAGTKRPLVRNFIMKNGDLEAVMVQMICDPAAVKMCDVKYGQWATALGAIEGKLTPNQTRLDGAATGPFAGPGGTMTESIGYDQRWRVGLIRVDRDGAGGPESATLIVAKTE